MRGCGGRAFLATLRSVHSYRTARSSAAEMIEWIRRIVAGLIGLHTWRGHRVSHVWGRVVRWSRSGPHRWSQACAPSVWCSVFGSLPQSREHFFSAVYSASSESGAELPDLHVTQNRPDGAADIALMRLFGRDLQIGDFQVLVEGLAERRGPVREPATVSLIQQSPERRGGGRLVRAGLLETAGPAGDRVGSGVDVHAERSAWELLDVAAEGVGHDGTITRTAVIRSMTRSTTANGSFEKFPDLEPPIGIEPMTYALRVRRSDRLS